MGISLGLSSQPLIPVPGCVVVLSRALWGKVQVLLFSFFLNVWLHGPFAVVCGLSLVVMGGFSPVVALGFFLLQSKGSRAPRLSS